MGRMALALRNVSNPTVHERSYGDRSLPITLPCPVDGLLSACSGPESHFWTSTPFYSAARRLNLPQ